MLDEAIYTVEEISRHLKVPIQAIQKEIEAGKLRAMNVGGFIRIGQFALADYKNGASTNTGAMLEKALKVEDPWLHLQGTADFVHTWPDGKVEHFQQVREGTASYAGREYQVKLGFTVRDAAGRLRARCLVIINRYPTVEFVKGDEDDRIGPMAAIIKDRGKKQIPAIALPPPEYEGITVGGYREVVDGPGASNGLAVLCSSDDFETMVKHALIPYRFREERS